MKECEYFERLISDNMDNSLSADAKAELVEHLLHCESCRQFEATLLAQRQLLQGLPEPESAERQVLRMRDFSKEQNWRPLWKRRISIPFPVAAVLSILMLAGWLLAFGDLSVNKSDELPRDTSTRAVEIIRFAPKSAVKVDTIKPDSTESGREI